MTPSDLPAEPNAALIALVGVVIMALVTISGFVIRNMIGEMRADVQKLIAAELEFQSKGWTTLPPDLSSSAGLTTAIRELQSEVASISVRLQEHDEWERSAK